MKSQIWIILPFEELAPRADPRRNARLLDSARTSIAKVGKRFGGLSLFEDAAGRGILRGFWRDKGVTHIDRSFYLFADVPAGWNAGGRLLRELKRIERTVSETYRERRVSQEKIYISAQHYREEPTDY